MPMYVCGTWGLLARAKRLQIINLHLFVAPQLQTRLRDGRRQSRSALVKHEHLVPLIEDEAGPGLLFRADAFETGPALQVEQPRETFGLWRRGIRGFPRRPREEGDVAEGWVGVVSRHLEEVLCYAEFAWWERVRADYSFLHTVKGVCMVYINMYN